MILSVVVCLKEIVEEGRDFPWPRPEECPRCTGGRVWGDGFDSRFFDGHWGRVRLRRYRCADCGCVLRMRPAGYFPRFQASIKVIRSRIAHRVQSGRWIVGISRSRQGHWLTSLRRKVRAYLGQGWMDRLVEGFDRLVQMKVTPVSRSM